MKAKEPDFLPHIQRAKFAISIFPLTGLLIIPIVLYTATNKLPCTVIGLIGPAIGAASVKLGIRFSKEVLFAIIAASLNLINLFLICWLAGPASPSFLIGVAVIGGPTMIFTNLRYLFIIILVALTMVASGSYLAGKSSLDIAIALIILLSYSIILVRLLQFTLIQGREVMAANKKVEAQNKIIEQKNKDILDSIRYAKRIQTSLMPTDKYIGRILSNKDKSTES